VKVVVVDGIEIEGWELTRRKQENNDVGYSERLVGK